MAILIIVTFGVVILMAFLHCYQINDTETLYDRMVKMGISKYCRYLLFGLAFLLFLGMCKIYYDYVKGLNAGDKIAVHKIAVLGLETPVVMNVTGVEDRLKKLEYYQEIIRTQLSQINKRAIK